MSTPVDQIKLLHDNLQQSLSAMLDSPRNTPIQEDAFIGTFLRPIAGLEELTDLHYQAWDIIAGDRFHGLSVFRGEEFLYNTPALASSGPLKNLSSTRLVDPNTQQDWGSLSDTAVTAERMRQSRPAHAQALQASLQTAIVASVQAANPYTVEQIAAWNKIFERYGLLAQSPIVQNSAPAQSFDQNYDIL